MAVEGLRTQLRLALEVLVAFPVAVAAAVDRQSQAVRLVPVVLAARELWW